MDQLNNLGSLVLGVAIDIHRTLGPGLLESVYEEVLSYELTQMQIPFERQKSIPIYYKGNNMGDGFRADIIVDQKIILELKSVTEVNKVHQKQLLTYLRLTDCQLGYILNFGAATMKEGIYRIVNGLE